MNPFRPRFAPAIAAVALAAALLAGTTRADLAKNAEFQASLAALADSLPGIAARKLQGLLDLQDPDDRKTVRLRLAEALVRSGQNSAAVTTASHPSIEPQPGARFWKAMALAALDQPAEAANLLDPLSNNPDFPHQREAALTRAALLEAEGQPDAALAALEPLTRYPQTEWIGRTRSAEIELARQNPEGALEWIGPDPVEPAIEEGRAEILFLRARIALADGRAGDAASFFHALSRADPETVPVSIRHRAFLGEADAHADAAMPDRSAERLIRLIGTQPDSPLLEAAFQRLEKFGLLTLPGTAKRLGSWADDPADQLRKALAAYYLGVSLRQAGRDNQAISKFGEFRDRFPDHPLATAASLETAELLVRTDRHGKATALIADLRAQSDAPEVLAFLDGLEARAGFSRGDYALAAGKFGQAAGRDGGVGTEADFNAAVAALYADDPAAFERFAARLQQAADQDLNAELMLELGLNHAAGSDSEAFETLEEFLRQNGDHPRSADARLALAELYLNQVPAQEVPAREHLEAARQQNLTPGQRERLDYVAVWVEIGAGNDEAITAAARRFVEQWKESDRRPAVFMILGEAYFRMQDHANAITYFERLAEEASESEFAIPALFFAAKAASLTLVPANQQFAIETWARVAEAGGPLEASARHEQGLLKLTLDQVDDAIFAFDSILEMEEVDPELRIAALCDKGQALFTKGTTAKEIDTTSLEAAITAFETVENDADAARSWKYQAAVRRGSCLEALGRTGEALEVYYDIVRSGGPLGPVASVPVEEFDWFFRAGIAAIQLLEKQENWEAAVKIADRLAQAGGPRAAEAANIADRLRLRHFIWEDPVE